MLKVGSVPYLVGRPLDAGLDEEPEIDLVREVPAKLVRGLRDSSLDVALVSSIELFRRPGYRYLEGIAVGGESTVLSVQVFLRRPLEEVRSVALDPASRTAAALTQVVWPQRPPGRRPTFIEGEEGVDPRAVEADAWLRIGDAALRETYAADAPPYLNPSEHWRELTGLPFVFAAWIARGDADLGPHLEAFRRSREVGRTRAPELIEEAAGAWRIPAEKTRSYLLEECLFELGDRQRPALLAFRDRAAALGLANGELEPEGIPLA